MLYRPIMTPAKSRDVLSLILHRLKLETSVAGAFNASGDYSVEIGEYTRVKLHLVLQGEFWLSIDGVEKPLHIREGDCVLLASGHSARFSAKPNAKKTVHLDALSSTSVNGIMTLNGGGAFFGIGLHFIFSGHFAKVIFAKLPLFILVPSHTDQSAALRRNIEAFRAEYMGSSLGRSIFLEHLAPIILLQILRSHSVSELEQKDWLWTLTEPRLSRAIEVIHVSPERPWTLESLAKVADMSRAGFASIFKKQVGMTPIEYLTHWRMQVACDFLSAGNLGLAAISEKVGYNSESAFSTAFKNIMKCRPGHFARNAEGRAL